MNKFMFYITMPFRTDYWIMNSDYDGEWDKILSEAIDDGVIEWETSYDAKLKTGETVWIRNYPYGYGTTKYKLVDEKGLNIDLVTVRPSRYYTIYKLRQLQNARKLKRVSV